LIVATVAMLVAAPAHAASCDERARTLAASEGGRVVSVQASGDDCIVKLLIPSSDGPPVRRTIKVAK
ncbi:MAG: hypothetical protein AAFO70_07575, partial [Pseudomonadota bacterium]